MANEELDILSKAKALFIQVFVELKVAQNILVRYKYQLAFAETLEYIEYNSILQSTANSSLAIVLLILKNERNIKFEKE